MPNFKIDANKERQERLLHLGDNNYGTREKVEGGLEPRVLQQTQLRHVRMCLDTCTTKAAEA